MSRNNFFKRIITAAGIMVTSACAAFAGESADDIFLKALNPENYARGSNTGSFVSGGHSYACSFKKGGIPDPDLSPQDAKDLGRALCNVSVAYTGDVKEAKNDSAEVVGDSGGWAGWDTEEDFKDVTSAKEDNGLRIKNASLNIHERGVNTLNLEASGKADFDERAFSDTFAAEITEKANTLMKAMYGVDLNATMPMHRPDARRSYKGNPYQK